jgi:predicted transcriptional regulator
MDWDNVSFVFSSKLRAKVLIRLREGMNTPTQVSREFGVPISHISRVLRELQERGLITCLTPNRKKAKFYIITERGNRILEELRKLPVRGKNDES